MKRKRGQVWIETVIYTLIALILIGISLSVAKPKIEEIQDRAVIEQSVEMMSYINSKILETVQGGSGNRREVKIILKKGNLIFDGNSDEIRFEMESRSEFSELNQVVEYPPVDIITTKENGIIIVKLYLNYSEYDININGINDIGSLERSSTPQTFFVTNTGKNTEGKPTINVAL
jgi:hypothetical protein